MKNKRGFLWIILGLLLIAAGLGLWVFNQLESQRAGKASEEALSQLLQEISLSSDEKAPHGDSKEGQSSDSAKPVKDVTQPEIPDHILNPRMEMPTKNIDGWDYIGVLELPSLELELPVISQWSEAAAKVAPCRYVGSAYTDDMVLAAHNYVFHFGPLYNIAIGADVRFTDIEGNVFHYKVAAKETLMPNAIEEMTSGDWDLTLFTCTLGGQYRVTVRCERVEDSALLP